LPEHGSEDPIGHAFLAQFEDLSGSQAETASGTLDERNGDIFVNLAPRELQDVFRSFR